MAAERNVFCARMENMPKTVQQRILYRVVSLRKWILSSERRNIEDADGGTKHGGICFHPARCGLGKFEKES